MGQFCNRAYRPSFISSLMAVAPTSSAPRKITGSKGRCSPGSGSRNGRYRCGIRTHFFRQRRQNFRFRVRRARIIGARAIFFTISWVSTFGRNSRGKYPRLQSHHRGYVYVIHHRICGFGFRHVWFTALKITPFESQTTMLCFCRPSATAGSYRRLLRHPRQKPPSARRDVFLHHAQAVEDGGSADNCLPC